MPRVQQNRPLPAPVGLPKSSAEQAPEAAFPSVMSPDSVRIDRKTVADETHLIKLAPEYQSRLGLKVAVESTRENGLDEIFIERDGAKYMLVGDNLDLSQVQNSSELELKGNKYQVLRVSDEANTITDKLKNLSGEALSSGFSNGVGGAAAGLTVMFMEKQVLKVGGKVGGKWALALGAVVGFASGFAWGAGGSVTKSLQSTPNINWGSIHDLADPNFKG